MIYSYTYSGFKLIDFNSDNWHTDEWYNWTLLDAMFQASFGDVPLPVVGGTANAITLNYTPDKVVANGLTVVFIPTAAPTGATTISVDGSTPIPLLVLGNPVAVGDFLAGEPIKALYDGVSFNTVAPLKKFSQINIVAGPSGATPNLFANDLTISSNDDAGINILTPNNKQAAIAFGDPQNNFAGGFNYNHLSDTLMIIRGGVPMTTLDVSGLRMAIGGFSMNVTGANDFVLNESTANVVRLGSSGATNGLSIDLATGVVTALNGLTVTGTLNATSITGNVNVGTATGILPLANGGTGADTAPLARDNLGLGDIAVQDTINNDDWSGTPLAIANGGTGGTDAATARTNLGIVPGTDIQPYDSDLAAIAALTTTPFGRSLLTAIDALAGRTLLGAIGVTTFNFSANALEIRITLDASTTLLIQGGIGTLVGNTIGTLTYPIPYSVAPVLILAGGTSDLVDEGGMDRYGTPSTSSCGIANNSVATITYTWLAIGKL